ncbi:zinc-dependent alcohol dehydrogenase family protein [Rhodovibrio salinarum]|uniref:Quinone oxidoreductase n=1 Tax=Rhodovibrio salinarum TaxID=1087 RepID=A0A934QH34_9PROT|nr:zinc-dependent alcohol dehydrogenase family protein [Rhodovibrio salinarum]MBK1696425.1 quinone oxidoreductase [Rhodovibrio salinarum]
MRAQTLTAFGGPDAFKLAEVDDPRQPGEGEVLIKLAAASVNPVDTKLRGGGREIAPEPPTVLGCDGAGTVVAVGPGVSRFQEGDTVFGCMGGVKGHGGTYAEYILADQRLIAPKPSTLDMREAAALPLVTITAAEALQRCHVGEGTRVLIRGGAGGVGHVAIQLAKARGAYVVATVSNPEKAEMAHQLGADAAPNYHQLSMDAIVQEQTDGAGFDVVLDATGRDDLSGAFAFAKVNGQIAAIVTTYTTDLSQMHAKGLSLHAVFMLLPMLTGQGKEAHTEILENARALAEDGRLRPHLDVEHFTLKTVPKAHERLESGKAVGKVVIDIDV